MMVTLLCPDSTPAPRPVSYISVVWLKLGMAMAGATTALDTVRFTAWLASLVPVSLPRINLCPGNSSKSSNTWSLLAQM